jgi:hypothetical protein
MSYFKMHIDELHSDNVFCEFREITKEGKGPMKIKSFSLDKMAEVVPKVKEMVAGDIVGVYYEKRGTQDAYTEIQWLDGNREPVNEEDQEWCIDMIRRACIDNEFDYLNAPPSVDEQVESFIKEFFDEEDDKPLEKKDFLEEFFAEIDDEDTDKKE